MPYPTGLYTFPVQQNHQESRFLSHRETLWGSLRRGPGIRILTRALRGPDVHAWPKSAISMHVTPNHCWVSSSQIGALLNKPSS